MNYAESGSVVAGIRVPPHSREAEQAVLGACLLDPRALDDCRDLLDEGDWYGSDHRAIWRAITSLHDEAEPADVLTVAERIKQQGNSRGIDVAYLAELAEAVAGTSNAAAYARVVRERREWRDIITAANRMADIGFQGGPDAVNRAQLEAAAIGGDRTGSGVMTGREAMRQWVDILDGRVRNENRGLQVGFRDLDHRWGGLRGGNLVVVAGRPGMGKTTTAMAFGENVAEADGRVLVFSLEMSSGELMDRTMSRYSRIPLRALRAGDLMADDWPRITTGSSRAPLDKLLIDETGGLHVREMRARARAWHRREPLSLIVIDYLQLMQGDGENQNLRISDISGQCKALAKELDIPVILLSQLNRSLEQRPINRRRPVLSDLRDSGSIEQDADFVVFVYRHEVYDENTLRKDCMEVITAKMRMGQIGTDYLHTDLARSTLEDQAPGYEPPPDSPPPQKRYAKGDDL